MSELLLKQLKFAGALPELFRYILSAGCQYTLGEGFVYHKRKSSDGIQYDDAIHMKGSLHYKGLAIDLMLFYRGVYITLDPKDECYQGTAGRNLLAKHAALYNDIGSFWESLDPDFRWGGRFKDANHFSCTFGGRK
jgi:hypothetical protein